MFIGCDAIKIASKEEVVKKSQVAFYHGSNVSTALISFYEKSGSCVQLLRLSGKRPTPHSSELTNFFQITPKHLQCLWDNFRHAYGRKQRHSSVDIQF